MCSSVLKFPSGSLLKTTLLKLEYSHLAKDEHRALTMLAEKAKKQLLFRPEERHFPLSYSYSVVQCVKNEEPHLLSLV